MTLQSSALTLLLLLSTQTTALFYLNTTGPNWNYPLSSLGDTTSPKCRAVYAQPINCHISLLAHVGGQKPNVRTREEQLNTICTVQCRNSLQNYVSDLGDACKATGDISKEIWVHEATNGGVPLEGDDAEEKDPAKGRNNNNNNRGKGRGAGSDGGGQGNGDGQPPSKRDDSDSQKDQQNKTMVTTPKAGRVWSPGNMLEYGYAQLCAKDTNNNFCLLSTPSRTIPPDPLNNYNPPSNCSDPCSVQFYSNTHKYGPAAKKYFVNDTISRRDKNLVDGWETSWSGVRNCVGGGAGGNSLGGGGNGTDLKAVGKDGIVVSSMGAPSGVPTSTPTTPGGVSATTSGTSTAPPSTQASNLAVDREAMGLWRWGALMGTVGLGFAVL